MQTDFLDAHDRHWHDALWLLRQQRLANADHLFGFAAECGLKRMMAAFSMPVDATSSPTQKEDRVHADKIWQRYDAYRSGHHAGAKYTLSPTSFFTQWEVSDRYANQAVFTPARVAMHRQGAAQVRKLIQQARREGIL